jgi:hypothetical protein
MDAKGSSLPFSSAVERNFSPVTLNDAFYDGQAGSRPRKLFFGVRGFEELENLALALYRDTHSIVLKYEHSRILAFITFNFYGGVSCMAGSFNRIRQYVGNELSEQQRVCMDFRQRGMDLKGVSFQVVRIMICKV